MSIGIISEILASNNLIGYASVISALTCTSGSGSVVVQKLQPCLGKERGQKFYRRNMSASCSLTVNGLSKFRCIKGVKELSTRYKVWLLDQFGVLHDGKKPYPGAIGTLENLAEAGVKMIIISNSSRRAWTTVEKMERLGFSPSLFAGVITSGELTHQFLSRRDDPWFSELGTHCIHMTWSERGAISLEGLGLQVVENIEEAEFILAHGTEAIGLPDGRSVKPMKLEDLEKILENSVNKGIPMVVANPDIVTVEARALRVMPGALGSKYEKLGGEVRWMGKPDQVIYNAAKTMAGRELEECIAVGDSLIHDILGANKSGMDSVFVAGGIHANELGISQMGEEPDAIALEELIKKHGASPTFIATSFTW